MNTRLGTGDHEPEIGNKGKLIGEWRLGILNWKMRTGTLGPEDWKLGTGENADWELGTMNWRMGTGVNQLEVGNWGTRS